MSSRSKGLFIEFILLFTFIVTISELSKIGLAYLVRHSDDAQTAKVNLILNHGIDPQIMIFGSSVAEVGFDSNVLSEGTKSMVYNAAIDGTKLFQNAPLINEFNSYSKECEYLIIGLTFFSLEKNKGLLTEPTRIMAHFDDPGIKALFYNSDYFHALKFEYLPFYAFSQYNHSYYKNAAIGAKNLFSNTELRPDYLGGHVPHNVSWYGEQIDSTKYGSRYLDIDNETIEMIKLLIEQVQQKDRNIIFVICPLYIEGQKLCANFDEVKSKIMDFKHEGAYVFDFTEHELNSSKNYFYNNNHLNAAGAEIFSQMVADSINNISNSSSKSLPTLYNFP